MASLLDPAFRYVHSTQQGEGYLQKKFARIKRELAEQKKAAAERKPASVTALKKGVR